MKRGLSTFFADPCFSSSLAGLFKLFRKALSEALLAKGQLFVGLQENKTARGLDANVNVDSSVCS